MRLWLLASCALVMFSPSARAVCPTYTLTIPYQTGAAAGGAGSLTDSAGNAWSYSFPAIPSGASFGVPVTLTPTVCSVVASASPDGTTSAAPNGAALHTAAVTWTWGTTAAAARPGEYAVNLNGAPTGIGSSMEVAHGGKLYVNTLRSGWYLWDGTGFASSSAP